VEKAIHKSTSRALEDYNLGNYPSVGVLLLEGGSHATYSSQVMSHPNCLDSLFITGLGSEEECSGPAPAQVPIRISPE
jgi:hypothetical protein